MRVAFVVPHFDEATTSLNEVVPALTTRFSQRGYDCRIFAPRAERKPISPGGEEPLPRIEVHRASTGGLRASFDRFSPDVIVCHDHRGPLAGAAARWGLTHGRRVGIQPHGALTVVDHYPGLWRRAPYRVYDRFVASFLADPGVNILATSRAERDDLVRLGFDPQRVPLLYLGTDLGGPVPSHAPSAPLKVLTVANFGRLVRDPRWATQTVQHVRERGIDAQATLAGPWRSSMLARNLDLARLDGATYAGFVPRSRLAQLYASADLFLYPSRYECFGLPVLEACMSGLPIVTVATGIAGELDIEGRTGALVASPDPRLLASAIERVYARIQEARRLARGRAAGLRRWFAWDRRAQDYLEWAETGAAPREASPSEALAAPGGPGRP